MLGISPGTRRMGVAVVKEGKLSHWQVQTFPGVWSNSKLECILKVIIGYIEQHSVERIAIKIPDALPTSTAFIQLIGSLNVMAQSMSVPVQYCTLRDLKLAYAETEDISRTSLIESMAKQHPELLPEYHKEKRNKEGYYYKMFEAVLCTQLP